MNIKDYLHLYLGCEIQFFSDFDGKFHKGKLSAKCLDWAYQPAKRVKPLLRPLSDLTEDEAYELIRANDFYHKGHSLSLESIRHPFLGIRFAVRYNGRGRWWSKSQSLTHNLVAQQVRYLLARGFDLFGLIDAGLALDKTKTPTGEAGALLNL